MKFLATPLAEQFCLSINYLFKVSITGLLFSQQGLPNALSLLAEKVHFNV